MPPTFLLAQLYTEASLPRVAHNALPDAPVQPHVEQRRRLRSLAVTAFRGRFAGSARRAAPVTCASAGSPYPSS
jgi:hypothetical protein